MSGTPSRKRLRLDDEPETSELTLRFQLLEEERRILLAEKQRLEEEKHLLETERQMLEAERRLLEEGIRRLQTPHP